jgi:hypothetical protein
MILASSLRAALDILGASSKEALIYTMTSRYGISVDHFKCSTKEEIEFALRQIFAAGADVIIARWNEELRMRQSASGFLSDLR